MIHHSNNLSDERIISHLDLNLITDHTTVFPGVNAATIIPLEVNAAEVYCKVNKKQAFAISSILQ